MSRLNKTANPQDSMKYHQRNAADTHLIGGIRIALVLLGVMIALPAFMMGASISRALGVIGGIQASLIGGLVLALVALPAAIAGAQSRKNSYQLIQQAFGERGGLLVNVVVVIAILGWFGVIAMMFGRAFQPTLPTTLATISVNWLAFFGCTLMTLLTIFGFRALDLLSVLASPFKVVVLLWTLIAALANVKWSTVLETLPTHDFSMTTGISMVVGGIMTGAMLAPDISRFARTPKQAAFACALAYGVGFPLVLILSGIPSVATGQMDTVTIMLSLGLGIPAMIAVLLIALTTNAYNLYASTLILSTLTPLRPKWQLALAAAGVGTTAGLMGISEGFVPYLILLSISIPPIAGVYLTNYYLGARLALTGEVTQWRTEAFLAWIVGSGFAYTANHIHLVVTSIPPLDSLLVSSLTYVCLRYLMARAQVARLERQDS